MANLDAIDSDRLPSGIRSVFCDGVNGLRMHYLGAGWENGTAPVLLLLHGFPELAYSWRKVMPALAEAGYRVIAPDQRGYGRTTGWDPHYDCDLSKYNMPNLVQDLCDLLGKLEIQSVGAVVGHDFGSSVAAFCALSRPDIFKSVALMSAPFSGVPKDVGTAQHADIDLSLAELPTPRKHYQRYYSTAQANHDMMGAAQGLKQFLRDYFFSKSADWIGNKPYPLSSWSADELAKMPTYYIMHQNHDIAETAAEYQVDQPSDYKCTWQNEEELSFYQKEYSRTGFQGGLHWYRCRFEAAQQKELQQYVGKKIEVPAIFISGRQDWGIYQIPGAIEKMKNEACTQMKDIKLIDQAGHWVQQEQPQQVVKHLLEFVIRSNHSR